MGRSYTGFGLILGVALGAGVGVALGNIALGVGVGLAAGLALGFLMDAARPFGQPRRRGDDSESGVYFAGDGGDRNVKDSHGDWDGGGSDGGGDGGGGGGGD